jgi:hypothetical protein
VAARSLSSKSHEGASRAIDLTLEFPVGKYSASEWRATCLVSFRSLWSKDISSRHKKCHVAESLR